MSFVRSGRVRFFICVGLLLFVFGMVCLWSTSQQQLEEQQQQNIHCEQQQEALNERLQSMVEQKFTLEKNHELERKANLRNFEMKLKDLTDAHTKMQIDSHLTYEKLEESYKILKSERDNLLKDCEVKRKQQFEDINNLEMKLQSELQRDRNVNSEIVIWKQKYELIMKEKERLELLLNATDKKEIFMELQKYNGKKTNPKKQNENLEHKIIKHPKTSKTLTIDGKLEDWHNKTQIQKSFNAQDIVSPGLYHIAVELTTTSTDNTIPTYFPSQITNSNNFIENENIEVLGNDAKDTVRNIGDGSTFKVNREKNIHNSMKSNQTKLSIPIRTSLILNSVENFQIVPKSLKNNSENNAETVMSYDLKNDRMVVPLLALRKPSTANETTNKSDLRGVALQDPNALSTSSKGLYPLAPNRKLPDNVAPIPDMTINDSEKLSDTITGVVSHEAGESPNNIIVNDNKNRYANVVKDSDNKKQKNSPVVSINVDSVANDLKDQVFINDANFNAVGDDGNFFDSYKRIEGAGNEDDKRPKMSDNKDEDIMPVNGRAPVGGIDVKNQNLLDPDNLNNEVAGDQGKEFVDGIRIEDGNEEDEDEDDYSNLAAIRQQGGQAIRH